MTAIAQDPSELSAGADDARPNALIHAGRGLAADLLSSIVFAGLLAVLHNATLATGIAVGVGVLQLGYTLARGKKPDAMQWLSLVLVLVFGGASLYLHDPRFIMFKPTLIYVAVGVTMLTPGWMTRYVIPDALAWSRDVVVVFGYVWAAMMFASAGLNAFMAIKGDARAWAEFFTIFPIASKGGLFAIQYLTTRAIVMRRMRAAGVVRLNG
jgi:intracellular septation protein A